ncbi:MAG: metallopeptidase TldD-related protein [Candidatus Muiribacteriota bacterium]
MIKETVHMYNKETAINITNSRIESVRRKNIKATGIRIYNNGFIGVSGFLGDGSVENAEKKAIEALNNKIEYPGFVTENFNREEFYGKVPFTDEGFIKEIEDILNYLRSNYSDFSFSFKSYISKKNIELKNSRSAYMKSGFEKYNFLFIYNKKGSGNIMDGMIFADGAHYDRNEFLAWADKILKAHNNKVEFPEKNKLPVLFIDQSALLGIFKRELNGKKIGTSSSIFTDKIDKNTFSKDFNLINCRKKEEFIPFFDMEGTVLKNDIFYYIHGGKIISGYSDKKTANKYNIPLSGGAHSEYDTIPELSPGGMIIPAGEKNVSELINNGPAIIVCMASGGDYDSDGNFATPVQLAFLYEDEEIKGRLPEFSLSGNVYNMFGEDFLGVSRDNVHKSTQARFTVLNMNLNMV